MKGMTTIIACAIVFFSCEKIGTDEQEPRVYKLEEDDELALPRTYAQADTLGKWKLVYDATNGNTEFHNLNFRFHRVQFPTADSGYITNTSTDMAEYHFSKDGGKTWNRQGLIVNNVDMQFLRHNVGFFFNKSFPARWPQEGGIFRLIKRPAMLDDWNHLYASGNNVKIVDITLANDSLALAVTDLGKLLKINKPLSSFTLPSITEENLPFTDVTAIDFHSASDGWLMTRDWYIDKVVPKGTRLYRTEDAGKSWTLVSSTKEFTSDHMFVWNNQQIWYTAGASIFLSRDKGNSWKKVHYKKNDHSKFEPRKIIFLNEHHGFLHSEDEIYETVDGGSSWTRSLRATEINDFTITGNQIVWAVSDNKVFRLDL